MMLRRLAAAALIGLLLGACGSEPDESDTSAVAYREVQCRGNPWEREWLTAHAGQSYPAAEDAQRDIFVAYWQAEGVEVGDVRKERYLRPGELVCQACDCPTGYEWLTRLPSGEVEAAMERGFERR